MGDVSLQQADLLLKLYDLRREPVLREARKWIVAAPNFQSMQDIQTHCPPGTQQNGYLRQVLTYWEMCANMVNRGLIDEEFFWENTGEQWAVWERVKAVVPEIRQIFKNPMFLANLEKHVVRMEAWREQRAPGSGEAARAYQQAMRDAMAKAKSA